MDQSENKWPKGDFTVLRIAERCIDIESRKSALAKPEGGREPARKLSGMPGPRLYAERSASLNCQDAQTETSR